METEDLDTATVSSEERPPVFLLKILVALLLLSPRSRAEGDGIEEEEGDGTEEDEGIQVDGYDIFEG